MGLVGLHAAVVQLVVLLAWLLECGQIPAVVGDDGGPRSLASLFLVLCLVSHVFGMTVDAESYHDT